jgi:hypothetical protein
MRRSFLLRPVTDGAVAVLVIWLALLALLVLPGIARAAGSVYVTSFLAPPGNQPGTISQYAISSGGQLSRLSPASVATGVSPFGIAVTPDGTSVYAVNVDIANHDPSVSQYDVDPKTGALSPKTPASVPGGPPGSALRAGVAGGSRCPSRIGPGWSLSNCYLCSPPQTASIGPSWRRWPVRGSERGRPLLLTGAT